jgi:hypothetical protein
VLLGWNVRFDIGQPAFRGRNSAIHLLAGQGMNDTFDSGRLAYYPLGIAKRLAGDASGSQEAPLGASIREGLARWHGGIQLGQGASET